MISSTTSSKQYENKLSKVVEQKRQCSQSCENSFQRFKKNCKFIFNFSLLNKIGRANDLLREQPRLCPLGQNPTSLGALFKKMDE